MAAGVKTGGRKKGTPNKVTGEIRARIQDEADPIGVLIQISQGEAVMGASDDGDGTETCGEYPTLDQRLHAAKWLGAKLLPDAKERFVKFKVGKIENPADALRAIGEALEAMGEGELTIGEARAACDVLNAYLRAFETNEMEERLAALEAKQ